MRIISKSFEVSARKVTQKFKIVTRKSGGGMVAYEKWSCTGGLIWKAFLVFWIGRRTWRFDCIFISCFVVSKSV